MLVPGAKRPSDTLWCVKPYKRLIWVYDLVTCSCAPRRGGTRTAPLCATCSWSTTSGTRPPRPRKCGCFTTSAARTRSTGRRLGGWSGRCAGSWTRGGRRRCGSGPGSYAAPEAWRPVGARPAVAAAGDRAILPPVGRTRSLAAVERALFTMVANGAWSRPRSSRRRAGSAASPGSPAAVTDDALYRAMDLLHQVAERVQE